MDKILSARLDEAAVQQLDALSHSLRITKKQLLEEMIFRKAREVAESSGEDVFSATSGTWKRREGVEKTIAEIRGKFEAGMRRRQI